MRRLEVGRVPRGAGLRRARTRPVEPVWAVDWSPVMVEGGGLVWASVLTAGVLGGLLWLL